MAIRDYLLSQLQARQSLAGQEYQRRQLELQLERERAAREQQRNLAIMKQVGQLADVGLKGVGMAAGALEAQQAKDTAARLAEAQARAELAGLEEYSPEELQIQEELPGMLESVKPKEPLPTADIEEKLAGLQAPPSPLEERPLQPRLQRDAATEDLIREAQKIKQEQAQRLASREAIKGLGLLGVEDLTQPEPADEDFFEFGEPKITPAEPPLTRTFETPQVEKISSQMDEQLRAMGVEPKTLEQLVQEGLPKEPPAEPADEDFFEFGEPKITPAEPVEPATEPEEPAMPAEAQRQEEAVDKALDKVERQTGYAVRRFKKTPNELADQIVNEVYAKKPSGNPILDFFTGDPSKVQREKLLAKAAVVRQIKEARANLLESDYDRFMKEKGMQLEEEKLEVARMAKEAALARAQRDQDIRLKTNLPSTERNRLAAYNSAQNQLERVYKYAQDVLEEGSGIPLGKVRAVIQAAINENAGIEGSISKGLGGGAGIALGATNFSVSAGRSKEIDPELLTKAFQALDKTGLSSSQKLFLQNLNIAIQNLGKSMEGGKLTDKDLLFYLQNLISNDDPQVALQGLNDLMERNYQEFEAYKQNLGGTYEERALRGFDVKEPTLFTEEEISRATEAGISPTARAMAQRARAGMGAPDVSLFSDVVGGELQTFLNIMKKIKNGTATQKEIDTASELAQKLYSGETTNPKLQGL